MIINTPRDYILGIVTGHLPHAIERRLLTASLFLASLLIGISCTIPKLERCEWSQDSSTFLYPHVFYCITPHGENVGVVNYNKEVWMAFNRGAICGSGNGYRSKEAAMACINKLYRITK